MLFALIEGKFPFEHDDLQTLCTYIKTKELYKESKMSSLFSYKQKRRSQENTPLQNLQDLIKCLLKKHPQERLGFKGALEIKNHAFFIDTNWSDLQTKQEEPPFKPSCSPTPLSINMDWKKHIQSPQPGEDGYNQSKHFKHFEYDWQTVVSYVSTGANHLIAQ